MARKLYFAYGSNLDFDQMAHRCPGAEYLGVATLPDHVLKMDSAGFATVVPNRGSHVQGALWNLSAANEESMDGYEGIATGCYEKTEVGVTYAGDPAFDGAHAFSSAYGYGEGEAAGLTLDAIIYLSTRPPFGDTTWREDYLERVRKGAAHLSLDASTRAQLDRISLEAKNN
jgi:hypothetical protein